MRASVEEEPRTVTRKRHNRTRRPEEVQNVGSEGKP